MNLPVLPADKANHAVYGTAIFAVGMLVGSHFLPGHGRDVGAIAAIVFAVGKEALDAALNRRASGDWQSGPHSVEPADAAATIAPALALWVATAP